jgi:hypothetical protein
MRNSATQQSKISRRTLITGCAAGGAATLATRALALEPSPVKVSKDSVHYRTIVKDGRRCGACKLFIASSSCVAVSGDIGRDSGCRIWLPKSV